MKQEERSDSPLKEVPNPRLFPRINQLAKVSFFIGIGDVIGGIYIIFGSGDVNMFPLLLIALFLTSVFGAFCGHCACKQIRARSPHQKGKTMAVFGLIGCYVYIGLCFFGFWLLSQYYIAWTAPSSFYPVPVSDDVNRVW